MEKTKNRRIVLSILVAAIFVTLFSLSYVNAAELVFNNFDDRRVGSNLGGDAGPMSHDGRHDPSVWFLDSENAVSEYALNLFYSQQDLSFLKGDGFGGYWMFTDGDGSYDVSSYKNLEFWIRAGRVWERGEQHGTVTGLKVKIELADKFFDWRDPDSYAHLGSIIVTTTNTWQKVVVPLTSFPGVDMRYLKQINVVIDDPPPDVPSGATTLYTMYSVDEIKFTGEAPPPPPQPPLPLPGQIVFDDFNDGILGSNLGGTAGAMSDDGRYDPELEFDQYNQKEGKFALKISYNFPSGKWCGYWSFTNGEEASSYDVSDRTDIRLWVKGAVGGETFKVELKDKYDNQWGVKVSASSSYKEIVIPLANFIGVDMSKLKLVSIVFDSAPRSGAIYIDYIRFTKETPFPPPIDGLILDDFNDGVMGNNLGGASGVMIPDGSTGDIDIDFTTDKYEGTLGLLMDYNIGTIGGSPGWVGYWTFMGPDANPDTEEYEAGDWDDDGKLGYDVTEYKDIRLWVKGAEVGQKFKVELADVNDGKHAPHIQVVPGFSNGVSTAYQEVVIPLYVFTGVDLTRLKQVNIIFDDPDSPSGIIYIDLIRFTETPHPYTLPTGLIVDTFNDGTPPNELGGGMGTMDPYPDDPAENISESYSQDAYEGLAALRLNYNRGEASWVGYWMFLVPDQNPATPEYEVGQGLDVSGYANLRFWVKGENGGENFRVELKDKDGNYSKISVSSTTQYTEIVLNLADFGGVDLKHLAMINFVFDQSPNQGTVYIDLVRFTGVAQPPPPPNQPPTAFIDSIIPNPATEGDTVTFTGRGEDADGNIAAYSWISSIDDNLSNQASFSKADLSVGTHTITFKVQDNNDAWSDPVVQELVIKPVTIGYTIVSVQPSIQLVYWNDVFIVDVRVEPGTSIAGVQFDLSFDANLIQANSVAEGNLLNQDGANTIFIPGNIYNNVGTIAGVSGAIITPGKTVSNPGIFARIEFKARQGVRGTSRLNLSDVIVGDINANLVPIVVNNGNVIVQAYSDWDVNMDGKVNVLDMILVGQRWGQTGTPHWIREDVNRDGAINVLDMILIGQNWTG